MDENYPDRNVFTVAEAEPDYVQYLGNGNDTFHAVFNFKYNNTVIRTVKNGKPYTNKGTSMIETIAKGYAKDLKDKIGGFYGTLLSSHDSYGGNRPFQQLDGNVGKTKLVGTIYLTLPGIPFVYYGEEIGMNTYTRSKYDRWLRTCMTWEGNEVKNNGFGNADKLWNHLNAGNAEENDKFNVAAEEKDPDSILNQYKAVIKARNENSALRFGDFLTLKTNNEFVAAYLRKNADSEVVVIHNFADKPVNVAVTLAGNSEVSKDVQDLLGSSVKIKASKKDLKLTKMAAYQSVIIKIK
jgi:glycosidase